VATAMMMMTTMMTMMMTTMTTISCELGSPADV
jgi:hypothetical protein